MLYKSGYARSHEEKNLRTMTLEELKNLRYGQRVYFEDRYGNFRECKVNGHPKTWKTRPLDVEVPIKYGLYEYSYARYINGVQSGEILLTEK